MIFSKQMNNTLYISFNTLIVCAMLYGTYVVSVYLQKEMLGIYDIEARILLIEQKFIYLQQK